MKIAIIGLGRMGLRHKEAIERNPECQYIGHYDPARFDSQNVSTLMKNADALVVASPSTTHAAYARLFDKPVLMEKPYCLTVESAKPRDNIVVSMPERYNYSTIPSNVQLIVTRFSKTPKNPKAYGGPLKDLLVHDLDLLLYSGRTLEAPEDPSFDGQEYSLSIGNAYLAGGYRDIPTRSVVIDGKVQRKPDGFALDYQLTDFVDFVKKGTTGSLCTSKEGCQVISYISEHFMS